MPAWPVVLAALKSRWLWIGLLILALGIQTARLSIRTGERDNYKLAADTLKKSYVAAQAAAEAEQKAYYASISGRLRDEAAKSETGHAKLHEDSQRASDGYIAAHRVRVQTGGSSSSTSAGTQGGSPAVPDGPASETDMVAVKPEDIHNCAADYAYAKSAYDFAQGLIVDGLAVPLNEPAPDPAFAR